MIGECEPQIDNPSALSLTVLCGGVCSTLEGLLHSGSMLRIIELPALFGLIEHPEHGYGLFDTGYSPRFFSGTRWFPWRIYRWLTPVRCTSTDTAVFQLAMRGISHEDVGFIVLSHFDADHIGGLRDFDRAEIFCSAAAWAAVRDKRGFGAIRSRLLPNHIPEDISERIRPLGVFDGPAIGPFEASHDFFGDGTFCLVSLDGHAEGHIGAFVRTSGEKLFLVGDACWTRRGLKASGCLTHRLLVADAKAQKRTLEKLQALRAGDPGTIIVPSHCPEAANEMGVARFPRITG